MNSFEIYSYYRNYSYNKQLDISEKRKYANEVLAALCEEATNRNKGFNEIVFISCVVELINKAKTEKVFDESKVYVYDACIFIYALWIYSEKNENVICSLADDNLAFLFQKCDWNREYFNYINITYENLKKVEAKLYADKQINKNDNDQFNTKGDQNDCETEHSINNGIAGNPDTKSIHNTSSTKENEDNILVNDIKTIRTEENKRKIEVWHKEIEGINQSIKSIQPDVRKMLETVMSFSNEITEKYILQFARSQIDLYDIIADCFEYHIGQSNKSENEEYKAAVENYNEFLEIITDSLAVFGVEEIVTSEGKPFDGEIHESQSKNFSSKSAFVSQSKRAGFKYKEIVIQKEIVEIKENNK